MKENVKRTATVRSLAPGVWNINEPWFEAMNFFGHQTKIGAPHADAYLIAGSQKAVLIDSLQSKLDVSLVQTVQNLTDLPVEVYFTHGHGDHVGAETENLLQAGFPLHLSHLDMELMYQMADRFFGGIPSWMSPENFIDLKAGERIDLGNVVLETFAVPGHTKGCICFLDRVGRRCYTGDAFGTLIIGKSTLEGGELDVFLDTVKAFENWVDDEECILYNGHACNVNDEFWTVAQLRQHRLFLQ